VEDLKDGDGDGTGLQISDQISEPHGVNLKFVGVDVDRFTSDLWSARMTGCIATYDTTSWVVKLQ
jgi:hypothetical protein